MTQSKGVSISKAGFVMALFGMGAICGGFIGGKLTDKFTFYFIQLFTLLGGGIMFFVVGMMESYAAICVATFILSVVNESFRPANAAAIAHYSKEENRTRSYSLNRLAINLGWAVGGAMGGFIASKSYHLLFWIDGTTNIVAALCLWLFLAPSKNKATAHKPKLTDEPKRSAYKDKPYVAFIVLTTLFGYCFFQLFSTMPVYFKKELRLSEAYIGLTMAVNGILITLFEMVAVHNLEGKRNPLSYIAAGTLLLGCSFIIFNIFPGAETLAMVSILFVTAGEIFAMPFMNSYWISRASTANRGQYAGLFTISWSVAQVLGPGTGSQIADHYGFHVLWWIIGIVSLVCGLGYRWLLKVERRTKVLSPGAE
jgi:predicted MFS family arabinose efflux permease